MNWQDDAILLGIRPFGEHAAVVEALTRNHGRHMGLVRGAHSKRSRGILEAGNKLSLNWRSRIDDQLGSYEVELASSRAALFFGDGLKLAGLASACATCSATLPEREVHTRTFEALDGLLQAMTLVESPGWVASYVRFELVLLEDLGFGLDLLRCAVTGETEGLTHVSPRTGRAVTAETARPYASRLLRLPRFLLSGENDVAVDDLSDGLSLSGHFLEATLLQPEAGGLPAARGRFIQRLAAAGAGG